MEHTLIVAGIGPGSKEYILPKALSVIEKARYLVGGHRALSDYGHAGQEMYPITGKLSLLVDWMESALKKDDVVVMVSGDPGYYSLLPWLKKRFAGNPIEPFFVKLLFIEEGPSQSTVCTLPILPSAVV